MEYQQLETMQEIRMRDVPWGANVFSNIRLMVESLAPEGWTIDVQVKLSDDAFDIYAVRSPPAGAKAHD